MKLFEELTDLRDRERVFRDRQHAGEVLARMLEGRLAERTKILAIPAGGVPVAAAIARALALPLDVAVVSKVTPSFDSEVGYGAVAFDGRIRIDAGARARLGVDDRETREGIARTTARVRGRVERLRRGAGPLVVPGEPVVLVDDGLASGLTMETAIEAVREAGAARVIVAVPTASRLAVTRLLPVADVIYCPNERTGPVFAVADAYEAWSDVDDATASEILRRHIRHPAS